MVGYTEIIDVPAVDREGRHFLYGVLFVMTTQPGMVGETYEDYQAYQVSYVNDIPIVKPEALHWRAVRGIYNKLEGKAKRLKYWGWLINFGPEAEAKRDEDTRAEIETYIR